MSEAALIETETTAPFGVYVHWPFCLAKCPYCDFNSHVRHGGLSGEDQARFRDAYLTELAGFAARTGRRPVTSVFFGGGTPSLMAAETVGAILDEIGRLWGYGEDPEITLEANPTSVEAGRFSGYRAAGVNRLSIGIQALNDPDLKALGRQHTAKEALAALDIAKQRFDRISFDLIYGRQGQSEAEWEAELKEALGYAADHLSLYQLTIEPGTAFQALYEAGKLKMPSGERAERLYAITQELCERAGLPAYEVSNHARPGSESRHNLIYWRAHDYAGIGPGAHARITEGGTRAALSAIRNPEAWLDAVEAKGSGLEAEEKLSRAETADEYLLMGLRLSEGISRHRLEALSGTPLPDRTLAALMREGLLFCGEDSIKATAQGRMVLDRLILELSA
ncbi:radical SAM family heme chaperone HemW [Methyloligella sp. 2.7D]|uniref:radical SAM family heme chaperone HemW n=1 Tax=unclassified Methyloligella TaxID=2625955 RepID=UPI00157BEADA|nr:radical SAM family heme chaperone HemW [Methyloligella sp. GL2]QKP76150.1 coproporphyrinogen III oxidase [Methyloligella sp. GL2]